MKMERYLSQHDEDKDNFYSVIEMSKDLLKDNDWWTVNQTEIQNFKEQGEKIAENLDDNEVEQNTE